MRVALMPNSEKDRAIENAQRIIDILSYYDTVFSMHSKFRNDFSLGNISFYDKIHKNAEDTSNGNNHLCK